MIGALRRFDLVVAADAAGRVDAVREEIMGAWAVAMVATRNGEDDTAVARLLSAHASRPADVDRAEFALALMGASLPEDDRRMLLGVVRLTLLEAARQGLASHLPRLARSAWILDRQRGFPVGCLAARALFRLGRPGEAERLLRELLSAPGGGDAPCVRFELALRNWAAGRPDRALALLGAGASVPPHLSDVAAALRVARPWEGSRERTWRQAHVAPDRAHARALARLASLLGTETSAAEIEARAAGQERRPDHPAFARAFFEGRGFGVVVTAGDPAVGEAALDAGLPFLLYRIREQGDAHEETPVLVRARDAASGFWFVDEGDLERVAFVSREAARKGRILVAIDPSRRRVLAGVDDQHAGRLGRALESSLSARADGEAARALGSLQDVREDWGGAAPFDLYLSWLMQQRFMEDQEETLLPDLYAALDRSRESPPTTAFEHFVHGQRLLWSGEVEEALEAFEAAERTGGPSPLLCRTRFGINYRFGRHDEALAAAEQALASDVLDTDARWYRGRVRARMGMRSEARGDLRRAMDRRPEVLSVALDLVGLELDERRPAAALAVVEILVARLPTAAED
ncbi:MAG: hypothetical protein ACYTG6_18275, partial [Planctomycetota bacterium]